MSEMRTFWTTPATTIDMSALTNEIAALRSQLAFEVEENTVSEAMIATLRSQLAAALQVNSAALDKAERERDEWKRRYFLVADAVAPQSDSAEHLADIARETRSERDEARRELAVLRDTVLVERQAIEQLRHRAERAERVVEAARAWLADLWRGDLNGTVIGVCMEYEPDGQYALWEQVAPIAAAVRALDDAEGTNA